MQNASDAAWAARATPPTVSDVHHRAHSTAGGCVGRSADLR